MACHKVLVEDGCDVKEAAETGGGPVVSADHLDKLTVGVRGVKKALITSKHTNNSIPTSPNTAQRQKSPSQVLGTVAVGGDGGRKTVNDGLDAAAEGVGRVHGELNEGEGALLNAEEVCVVVEVAVSLALGLLEANSNL